MRFAFRSVLGFVIGAAATLASAADPQVESFARIYRGACVQHISDLNVLRGKLRGAPQLPAEHATLFLQGSPGVAYPVPDNNGTFVVALPSDKALCALFARRINAALAEENFLNLVGKPPEPFVARLISEESNTTAANGPTKTVMYQWSAEGVMLKVILTLTTATSEQAQLQGMASVALSR